MVQPMLYQGGNVGLCVVCTRVISQGVPVQYKNRVYCKYYVELSMKLLPKRITTDLYRTFLLHGRLHRLATQSTESTTSTVEPVDALCHVTQSRDHSALWFCFSV